MPKLILIAFLFFFFLDFIIERVLSFLNVRHVLANRDQIPSAVKETVSPETYRKSIEYTLAKSRLDHLEAIIGAILTLFFLFSGYLPWLQKIFSHAPGNELFQNVLLIFAFMIVSGLLALPLELYSTFRLEARFGFNKMTVSTFIIDQIKSLALMLILGIPFLYFLLFFMTQSGPWWWLWSALFVIGFQCLMIWIYPVFIAPLFNKFTPLQEGELKTDLEKLARECQFAAQGIFVMDGSKRSAHSNAYFTGFGKARRIVLFDTLIQQLNSSELVAVLAHEIGHFKKKHIIKMFVLSTFLTVLGFYVLSLIIDWKPLYDAFGIHQPSISVRLIVISLISGAFTFWLSPLFHSLSRKHEYEADAYASAQTGNAEFLVGALFKLSEKNLSNLTPHPAFSWYHYSHPTLLERLAALRKHAP
jgi:STE24 endopeptidase